jgi:hypothetical protein
MYYKDCIDPFVVWKNVSNFEKSLAAYNHPIQHGENQNGKKRVWYL